MAIYLNMQNQQNLMKQSRENRRKPHFWNILGHFFDVYPFYPILGIFAKYDFCVKNYITIRNIISGHFQPKLMTQFTSKVEKPHFWAILGYFGPVRLRSGVQKTIYPILVIFVDFSWFFQTFSDFFRFFPIFSDFFKKKKKKKNSYKKKQKKTIYSILAIFAYFSWFFLIFPIFPEFSRIFLIFSDFFWFFSKKKKKKKFL